VLQIIGPVTALYPCAGPLAGAAPPPEGPGIFFLRLGNPPGPTFRGLWQYTSPGADWYISGVSGYLWRFFRPDTLVGWRRRSTVPKSGGGGERAVKRTQSEGGHMEFFFPNIFHASDVSASLFRVGPRPSPDTGWVRVTSLLNLNQGESRLSKEAWAGLGRVPRGRRRRIPGVSPTPRRLNRRLSLLPTGEKPIEI